MVTLFNRTCVKLWLFVGTFKRCSFGLVCWLLSDSYKLSELKDFCHG